MNATDRKEIARLVDILTTFTTTLGEIRPATDDAFDVVQEMYEDEQGKYENLTEGFQAAESGVRLEEAANLLGEAKDALEDLAPNLDAIELTIDTAIGFLEAAANT